ncbi:MAG TPA: ABC transporter permease [Solirubrobacterales bacterium]|nr:ABC transporter permease [Solirubrobacterales bacterium]
MSERVASPPLREVRGPSALGGGRRRFFDLLWLMSMTEFKRTYFGTVFGYLWSLVRPLMLFGVLLFVFTQVFRLGAGLENYPVLLLIGIVQFTFFQEATTNAVTSVAAHEGIVRKTQFPRLVIPLSTVITAAINFCLNLVVVLVFVLAWGVDPSWSWLLFPVAMLALFVLTTAVSMALSVLYIGFRDVAIIWTVAAQMLFYASPILYPLGPKGLNEPGIEEFLMINPLAVIFEQVRVWLLHEPAEIAPGAAAAAGGWPHLLPAVAIYLGLCAFGVWIFNRNAPRIAEEL